MDKIIFSGMKFYAYHGVFPEENKLGQMYDVDVEVFTNLQKAGVTDQLEYTVNYAELYEIVKSIVEGEQFQLIEALAEKISARILLSFEQIQQVRIKVTKPNPPIPGHYDSVAVEIQRERTLSCP
ncbi:dihydroneopterin aldolase [Caldalkalibacillus mannanilyticus]|uniref:dihydroneopterin aldolase n=1 Tax=Caldalkalibacillus mannanilyticus TaxID=1418 RepID=UPI00046998D2|nr:dihydroneopterin aldolase [Caldalkalibacillus mannanilyticus]